MTTATKEKEATGKRARTRARTRAGVTTPAANEKVDQALSEIRRRSEEIRAHDAQGDALREERNLLVYRSTIALRDKTGGRPRLMELADAMGVRHSYVSRLLEGKGHPVAAQGRVS